MLLNLLYLVTDLLNGMQKWSTEENRNIVIYMYMYGTLLQIGIWENAL